MNKSIEMLRISTINNLNEDIEKRDNISSIWNMLSTSLVFGLSTILLTRKYVWKSMKLEVDKEKKF